MILCTMHLWGGERTGQPGLATQLRDHLQGWTWKNRNQLWTIKHLLGMCIIVMKGVSIVNILHPDPPLAYLSGENLLSQILSIDDRMWTRPKGDRLIWAALNISEFWPRLLILDV